MLTLDVNHCIQNHSTDIGLGRTWLSCNVSSISSFFSPERETARERELTYILVGQLHPEGWGEDERGGEQTEKRRGKEKKGEMGTQHIREYEESKREQSRA